MWKAILRALGLSKEAHVHIDAPGIEVRLTGDPDKVRALLSVVRRELEAPPRRLPRNAASRRQRTRPPMPAAGSQVVQPTELDEMDSPYALPEAVVMPVPDEDVTDERVPRRVSSRQPRMEPDTLEPDTLLPPGFGEVPSEETVSGYEEEGPDAEATAVAPNPRGRA